MGLRESELHCSVKLRMGTTWSVAALEGTWEWGLAWGAGVGTGEVGMGFWRQEMAFRMGGEFGVRALRWMRVIEEEQGQRSTAFPSLWKSEPKCESALK